MLSKSGYILKVNASENGYEFVTDVRTFKENTDVTPYISTDANKFVVVNGTGTGLTYKAVDFKTTTLTDMPSSLTSQAGKMLRVNATNNGYELFTF
jgi:hypothetical protein